MHACIRADLLQMQAQLGRAVVNATAVRAYLTRAAMAIAAAGQAMLTSGQVNTVVIANVPALDVTPYIAMSPAELPTVRLAVTALNGGIAQAAGALGAANPNATVLLWDVDALMRSVGEYTATSSLCTHVAYLHTYFDYWPAAVGFTGGVRWYMGGG